MLAIVIRIGDTHFGIPYASLVASYSPGARFISRTALDFVRGALVSGGTIIPVIDLARLLGLSGLRAKDSGHLTVITVGNEPSRQLVALESFEKPNVDNIELGMPPETGPVEGIWHRTMIGIGKCAEGFAIVLDPTTLFGPDELSALKQFPKEEFPAASSRSAL